MKKTIYFLSSFILFLLNINIIYAAEYNFTDLSVQGYNNNGNSLTNPSVFNCNEIGSCGMEITTIANSYGGAWGIQSPIPLVSGHQYAITLRIRTSNGTISLSSKPNIALGSSMSSAKTNYQNSSYNCNNTYYKAIGNQTLQYIIQSQSTLNYLIIPFTTTTNSTGSFMIDNIIIDDLGATPLSETEINNYLNNQTSVLQADINNLQDNLNGTIKDTFESCDSGKNLINIDTLVIGSISPDGVLTNESNYGVMRSGYIKVDPNTTYTFKTFEYTDRLPDWFGIGEFNNNKQFIQRITKSTANNYITFTTSSNTQYIILAATYLSNASKIQLEKGSSPSSYEPYGEICKNKIDETNDKLDDLNDNITNSDSSGATNDASDFFSNFNTDTFGLTSVITAPLELIKSVTSKSCTPLQLNVPFVNKELNLPCLSSIYEGYFGSFLTIYRTITFGFVSYWVCIKIFNLVKDFKNPEHDEIEVLDL